MLAAEHQLGVEDKIEREEAGAERRVHDVQNATAHEYAHDAEDHEYEREHEQVDAEAGKVPFSLKGE